MTVRREDKIAFYDLKTHTARPFRKDKSREQLDRVVTTRQDSAKTLERMGLEEIKIRLGVSAGLIVVTPEGDIGLLYGRPKWGDGTLNDGSKVRTAAQLPTGNIQSVRSTVAELALDGLLGKIPRW